MERFISGVEMNLLLFHMALERTNTPGVGLSSKRQVAPERRNMAAPCPLTMSVPLLHHSSSSLHANLWQQD